MSDNTAEFTVKLNDKFSGPAKNLKGSTDVIERSLRSLNKQFKSLNKGKHFDLSSPSALGFAPTSKLKMKLPKVPKPPKSSKDVDQALQSLGFSVPKSTVKLPKVPKPPKAKAVDKLLNSSDDALVNKYKRLKEARDKDNRARRAAGVRELPSLDAKSPSMIAKGLRALGAGGVNTGIFGQLVEMAPAIAAVTAAVFALKGAFDLVVFSIKTVTTAIAEFGAFLTKTVFHALNFTQRMEMGLGALIKNMPGMDGTSGKDVFNAIRGESQRLGLDVEDTTESFRKLLAAQFSLDSSNPANAMTMIRSMADLKAAGATESDIKHALLAISQIKMKGKLQAEEVTRQLANAGVSSQLIYEEIGKDLGLTGPDAVAKVMEKQKAGEITADMALPAIVRAIGRKTGSSTPGEFASTKALERIDGMTNVIKGAFFNAFVDIAQMIEQPITNAAKVVFKSLNELFNSSTMTNLKESLASVFTTAAEFVQTYWPELQPIIYGVAATLTSAFDKISLYIRENGNLIMEKITMAIKFGYLLGSAMMAVTTAFYMVADAIATATVKLQKFLEIGGTVFQALGALMQLVPGIGAIGAGTSIAGSGMSFIGSTLNDFDAMYARGPRSQYLAKMEEQRELTRDASGVVNVDDLQAPGQPQVNNIRSFDDLVAHLGVGSGKSVTINGDIITNVDAISSDPDALAELVGPSVRTELHKLAKE